MPEILVLQHVACEPLGAIEPSLRKAGLGPRYIRIQEDEPVPLEIGEARGLIVMGGPMGVSDEATFPFLTCEMHLITQALTQGLPILGVCLGAQLLAAALGAPVREAVKKEIGWHQVILAPEATVDALWREIPSPFTGFHWHGDYFETPPGCVSLASSALTPCQAFRSGDAAYGFQFHLEVTEPIVRDWTTAFAGELVESGTDSGPILDGISRHLPSMHQIGEIVFDRWVGLVSAQSSGSR